VSPLSTEVFAAPDPVDPVATADPHCADAHIVATQRVGSDCEGTHQPLRFTFGQGHGRYGSQIFTVLVSNRLKMMTIYWWFMVVHVSASVDLKIF